jgi:hypothetical protein
MISSHQDADPAAARGSDDAPEDAGCARARFVALPDEEEILHFLPVRAAPRGPGSLHVNLRIG